MPHSDSVQLKPLGMKFDLSGGDPATVAEVSTHAGKDREATGWGGERGLGFLRQEPQATLQTCWSPPGLQAHPGARSTDAPGQMCCPESVISLTGGECPRPTATPMHRAHLSTAIPSGPSLVGTKYWPAQGLCVIWKRMIHCLDGHSPTRAGLAPIHTSAHTCTAIRSSSDPRKVPKICRKRKGRRSTFSTKPLLWVFPKHSIPFWLHYIPAGRTLGHSPPQEDLGPWALEGAEPAPHPRILSQVSS